MSKLNLLLIDDDEEFAEIFQWKIRKNLSRFDFVLDGEEGLGASKSRSYDVIVVDKNLPDKEYQVLIEEIKKSINYTPLIVVLTGEIPREEDVLNCKKLGVHLLEKDLNLNYIDKILGLAIG